MGYTQEISKDFKMQQATVFTINKSQAIRLPKKVALPDNVKKVDIIKIGNARLITPVGTAWNSWFDGPPVSDDFMTQRDQPNEQKRDSF